MGAPADEISIMPTRRADSTGASSMIESDSISVVSDAARGDKRSARGGIMPRRCHGGACCGGHGMDDQAGAVGAALDGERDEQCADGAAASRTTAPGSQAPASQAQASRRLGHAGERERDGGRIIL